MLPRILTPKPYSLYFNVLGKVAAEIKKPAGGNARHAACIIHKGTIVAFGTNTMKSHPFQAKYGRNDHSVFLHAETNAIKTALKVLTQDELRKCTMYVCRVKYTDHNRKKMVFGMSKPCSGCFRCINEFGISEVLYTLDDGTVTTL
jgi:deoxycytidylate deaminase